MFPSDIVLFPSLGTFYSFFAASEGFLFMKEVLFKSLLCTTAEP